MTRAWTVALIGISLLQARCTDEKERAPSAMPTRPPVSRDDERPLINDDLKLLLMPWATRVQTRGATESGLQPFAGQALFDQPAAPVPSGLYSTGAVTQISGPVTQTLLVASDYAWQRAGCGESKSFRVYQALLETLPGKTRPMAVLIDAAIDSATDAKVVQQTFRGWASQPPELRADADLPLVWEINKSFVFTVGTICDSSLTKFSTNAVVTGFSAGLYDDNAALGFPGLFGILWHEAAGHLIADSRPGTTNGPIAGEPYMTLYSHRAVLGSHGREVNADRTAAVISSIYADRFLSDPGSAEPAAVARRVIKCGFPKNYAVMSAAFGWLASYFSGVDCTGYTHPVRVINGHFPKTTDPNSVEIYGDSGARTTCLVNMVGVQTPSLPQINDTDRVVAQVLPSGVLACSAVCPNGTVLNIYGLGTGNGRQCIGVGECFKQTGFRAWYNASQDYCEFASTSASAETRCASYFDGETVTFTRSGPSGTEVRCISRTLCRQRWAPPMLIGYGGTVQGSSCAQ